MSNIEKALKIRRAVMNPMNWNPVIQRIQDETGAHYSTVKNYLDNLETEGKLRVTIEIVDEGGEDD